jgi:hypothetical protein
MAGLGRSEGGDGSRTPCCLIPWTASNAGLPAMPGYEPAPHTHLQLNRWLEVDIQRHRLGPESKSGGDGVGGIQAQH